MIFYLLSLLAILALLLAARFVVDAFNEAGDLEARLAAVEQARREVGQYRSGAAAELALRMNAAQDEGLDHTDRRIREVTRRLQAVPPANDSDPPALFQIDPRPYAARLASDHMARLEHALLTQELAYLQQVRARLVVAHNRERARRELERLGAAHRAVHQQLLDKRMEIGRLGYVDARRMELPKQFWGAALNKLADDARALHGANERAAAAYGAQEAALRRVVLPKAPPAFSLDQKALDHAGQALDERVLALRRAVSDHPVSRLAALSLQVLPQAVQILLLCIAGRYIVKLVLYFILAPLAARGAPVRFDGRSHAGARVDPEAQAVSASASAVSQSIRLGGEEELLVLPGHLQSTPVGAVKTTRWMLKGSAWASLSSGMSLLTCVRTATVEERVVVSASDDGFSELALIRIPGTASLVVQPRALVGVVCHRAVSPDIAWYWRLTSLQAWLTLQLRYFVIHGPATLLVQGKRGVRVEQASGARAVRQAATLGFSASLAYSVLRSAPFLPYLRGQSDLLYDRFTGDRGVFIYDETQKAGSKGGRIGRGIEGMTDTLLKLVGL